MSDPREHMGQPRYDRLDDRAKDVHAEVRADQEQHHENEDTVSLRAHERPGQLDGQYAGPDAEAVERGEGQKVEDGEDEVDRDAGSEEDADIVFASPTGG